MNDSDCLFCRIAAGQIPADVVYRDDDVLAFRDVNPQAPTHVLVIPRQHIASAHELDDAELARALFGALRAISDAEHLDDGYRVVTNVGEAAGQTVQHLHFHLLGGRSLGWPPG
jgi:histidine triad (HIT) family protein